GIFWLIGLGLVALAGWLWIKDRPHNGASVAGFAVREDLRIEVIATEPDVVNPMSLSIDEEGNIYVTESATYRYGPEGAPDSVDNTIKRIKPGKNGQPDEVKIVARGFDNPVMGVYIHE